MIIIRGEIFVTIQYWNTVVTYDDDEFQDYGKILHVCKKKHFHTDFLEHES